MSHVDTFVFTIKSAEFLVTLVFQQGGTKQEFEICPCTPTPTPTPQKQRGGAILRTPRQFKLNISEECIGENIVKWIKGQRISWLVHLERMEEDRMP